MSNIIILGILIAVVGMAGRYVYRQKKKGARCIGCSANGCCCKNGICNSRE